MESRLLIVEDDVFVQRLLAAYLRQVGYKVSQAESGNEMFAILDKEDVDLVILDLNLPDEDGLVLARKIRARWSVPIIVLTARSRREDKLAALEIGADDFMSKPADPEELALRVRNVLKRAHGGDIEEQGTARRGVYHFNGWTLDVSGFSLLNAQEQEVALTPAEFKLLATLVKAENRVLTRDQLLDAISDTSDSPGDRVVDVLISRLRKKMEPDAKKPEYIVTVVGVGYKFGARVS